MNIDLAPAHGIARTKVLANPAGAKQAAEKVKKCAKKVEIHPSAAEAAINLIDLSARVNSCPFKTTGSKEFSRSL